MGFHIGQKVVCVADKNGNYGIPEPSRGEICTIDNIYVTPCGKLTLEILEYPQDGGNWSYPGWLASCFRPVHERKTDISIFQRMLLPKKVDA